MAQHASLGTIAIIGKSTVPQNDPSFIFIEQLAYELVASGFTVRHGGYAGGIMEAAAIGANRAIVEFNLPADRNVGVPESRFDSSYARTSEGFFLKPARDICNRLRSIVLVSDYVVVAPRGGDGTMLELQLAMHENLIGTGHSAVPRPVVVCELAEGTPWTKILQYQLRSLDNGLNSITKCSWMHIVHSAPDALKVIQSLS